MKALEDFVLSKIQVNLEKITADNWDQLSQKQWLLFLCAKDNICPEKKTMIKLAASLVSTKKYIYGFSYITQNYLIYM